MNDRSQTLRIGRLTPRAAAWLQGPGPTRVRSIHTDVIYLERSAGLAALTTAAVPLSPISLQLRADTPWPGVTLGTAARGNASAAWVFDASTAERWCPRPDWSAVAARPLPPALIAARADAEAVIRAAAPAVMGPASTAALPLALLGLGPGLTPAGDDVLIGRLLAYHAGRLAAAADVVAEVVAAASTRTTRLSQALLAAAAAGECSQPWHDLWARPGGSRSDAIRVILGTGQTSGAATLWGFLTAAEVQNRHAPDR